MTDDGGTKPEGGEEHAELLKQLIALKQQNKDLSQRLSSVETTASEKAKKNLKEHKDAFKDLQSTISNSTIGNAFASMDIGKSFEKSIGGMQSAFKKSINQIRKNSESLGSAIESGVAIGAAAAKESLIKNLGDKSGFNELQKQLMEAQEQAIQMSMAFGKGWRTASADTDTFINSLTKTIDITNATKEEVTKVRGALHVGFGPDAIKPLNVLQGAMKGVGSSIDLTTTALLISKATGVENTAVAKAMSDAHLELGMSVDETAEAFGHIRDAAKNSGLEFGKVMDSVMQSAKALKWYGSTVETVTPLFKRFNESMKGVGKEGLTPELLNDFVTGLNNMQFGTRALLSMSSPGAPGAGKGVLGGGLAMEQAMETGEGMEGVTKSLGDTLKKYSGQDKILTREEALADPQLERAYVIQRQMLQKLTGIQGAGKQNETLRALENIDKNGMAGSKDAQDTLGELLAAGKKTAEDTTTELAKSQLDTQKAILRQGKDVLDVLTKRLRGSDLQKGLQAIDRGFSQLAQTGRGGGDVLKAQVATLRQRAGDRVDTYGRVGAGSTRKEIRQATRSAEQAGRYEGRATRLETASPLVFQQRMGAQIKELLQRGQRIKEETGNEGVLKAAQAKAEEFRKTGTLRGSRQDNAIRRRVVEETLEPMKDKRAKIKERVSELQEKAGTQKRGTDEAVKTQLELAKLKEESKFLGTAIKNTRRNLNSWQDTLTKQERKKGTRMARRLKSERGEERQTMMDSPVAREAPTKERAQLQRDRRIVAAIKEAGGKDKQDRIITKEDVGRDSSLEKAHLAQRQKLSDMSGIKDEGQLNQVMQRLQRDVPKQAKELAEQAKESKGQKIQATLVGSDKEAAAERAAKLETGEGMQKEQEKILGGRERSVPKSDEGREQAASDTKRTEEVVVRVKLDVDSDGNFVAKDDIVIEVTKALNSQDSANELRNAVINVTSEASARR